MKKTIRIAACLSIAAAVILAAVCQRSRGVAPPPGSKPTEAAAPTQAKTQNGGTESSSNQKLYNCPMHPTYTSDKPGDCAICGMKLVEVVQSDDQAAPGQKPAGKPAPKKKTMYRSTMNPNEVSDKPVKDSMGMDMVPFEVEESGTVTETAGRIRVMISPERQQLIGVKTAPVKLQPLCRLIQTVGRVDYAEPNLSIVNLKFDGWLDTLYVNTTGAAVRKGDPLFNIYSPDLVAAEQEYLIALKAGTAFGDTASLVKSAREKLRLWDITDRQVEDLGRTGDIKKVVTIYSPVSGIVIEKNIVQGQKVMSGENLFKIADLSRVWILGEVYEYELPLIKTGLDVEASLSYYPGETFAGRITFVYPYLKPETRTNLIRVEAGNPGFKLKPEMYANLIIRVDFGTKLALPADAVLDAGVTKIVFVASGDGYFEPREVKLGVKGQDLYEILGGVSAGEIVVTSANFLVDSESSLKAALSRMTRAAAGARKHD